MLNIIDTFLNDFFYITYTLHILYYVICYKSIKSDKLFMNQMNNVVITMISSSKLIISYFYIEVSNVKKYRLLKVYLKKKN